MDIGSAVGRNQGVSEQQLLELADFESSSAFSELERLVLRYAVAMTETPADVPGELFAELRSHFSPKQMVELTSAIAWAMRVDSCSRCGSSRSKPFFSWRFATTVRRSALPVRSP